MTDPRHAPPHHGKTSTPWTLTLTDATGEVLTLSPRRGMTIDRADCLIIDDPAPRSMPPTVDLLTTPGPVSTWSSKSSPLTAAQRASEERRPGAMRRAELKRWRRRQRNIRNRRRERHGRIRQEVRVELHDLTRPGGAT